MVARDHLKLSGLPEKPTLAPVVFAPCSVERDAIIAGARRDRWRAPQPCHSPNTVSVLDLTHSHAHIVIGCPLGRIEGAFSLRGFSLFPLAHASATKQVERT